VKKSEQKCLTLFNCCFKIKSVKEDYYRKNTDYIVIYKELGKTQARAKGEIMKKKKVEFLKGMCPHCKGMNIEYGEHDFDDNYLIINGVCEDCEARIDEQYKLEFIGTSSYKENEKNIHVLEGEEI
jgi:hypothetical protein